jgi:hypothetical protein
MYVVQQAAAIYVYNAHHTPWYLGCDARYFSTASLSLLACTVPTVDPAPFAWHLYVLVCSRPALAFTNSIEVNHAPVLPLDRPAGSRCHPP